MACASVQCAMGCMKQNGLCALRMTRTCLSLRPGPSLSLSLGLGWDVRRTRKRKIQVEFEFGRVWKLKLSGMRNAGCGVSLQLQLQLQFTGGSPHHRHIQPLWLVACGEPGENFQFWCPPPPRQVTITITLEAAGGWGLSVKLVGVVVNWKPPGFCFWPISRSGAIKH